MCVHAYPLHGGDDDDDDDRDGDDDDDVGPVSVPAYNDPRPEAVTAGPGARGADGIGSCPRHDGAWYG